MKQNLTEVLLKPVVTDVMRSQTLRFSLLLLLLATIPITALLAQQEQDIRQRAQEITTVSPPPPGQRPSGPAAPPICKIGLNSLSAKQPCAVNIDKRPPPKRTRSGVQAPPTNGFRFANFFCHDGFSGTVGNATTCYPSNALNAFAQQVCKNRSSCNPIPTGPPKASPSTRP